VASGGVQEASIVVKGGYTPDTIRVEAGRPVRLVFNRQETDPCSDRVVLDAFGLSAELPEGADVALEFTPTRAGSYEFACQMGMLRGKVVAS
jgi:plastocyanin domain-containing protein